MSNPAVFLAGGAALFVLSLYGLVVRRHLLIKILAINMMGSGVFTMLMAASIRSAGEPDPVPHAMVLTGIVVTVAATALGLALLLRVHLLTGSPYLPIDEEP